jgi:DNA (cytosine-5)-methyltransferase 1
MGLRGAMALNHWALAIETHNTNHPEIPHDCTDVSACDPRRYPSTDILITSPECTTHSPAGGTRRLTTQRDLFKGGVDDPSTIRSRATMFDVVRFSEFHRYRLVIVENVLEVTRWELFPEWLTMMQKLGYRHRIVSLNSMFAHPTPQSRDRIYVVFWQKGNRTPDLEFRPKACCFRCGLEVEALQTWKNGRTIGKYRQQYLFTCPKCRIEVQPYYFAALNALDFSLPAERIGDRARPLRPRTLERIRFGLDRYGKTALVVRTNMTSGVGCRVRDAVSDPLDTQPASGITGMVAPAFLVETAYSHAPSSRTRGVDDPLTTQSARSSVALVGAPFLVNAGSNGLVPRDAAGPMPGLTCCDRLGIVVPPAAMVPQRSHSTPRSLLDPLPVVCTGNHHMIVQGAALLTMRGGAEYLLRRLDAPLPVQVAQASQDCLISRAPFIVSQYRTNKASSIDRPVPTVTVLDRHELVTPGEEEELRVEDCYFRMLQPHEIGAAMAFPDTYVVLGNKRDRVKQYGNAVTPPAMEWLIRRAVSSLAPEVAA